jgi:hypothetical protein
MMLAIVALSATFLVPFPARRSSTLNAHKGRSRHLMLNAPDVQQLATPEESLVLGQLADLLATNCSNGEEMPYEAVVMLRSLASPTWGARGLFVTLLTDERYDAVFKLPLEPQLLTVIGAAPENKQLLTTQLATSTAMELVHVADGSEELAAASRLTRERSKVLLNALLPRMMGLTEEVQRLRTAAVPWKDDTPPESADKEWIKLTSTYTPEQRAAINAVLDELLAPFDGPVEGLWKSPEIWATAGYGAYALVRQWDPVFCPAGPTSANALVLANALTSVSLAAWVAYVLGAANAAMAKPEAARPSR